MSVYKRIGILGGMSPESTAEFYSVLAQKHYDQHHDYEYPEIVIFSVNFARMIDLQEAGDHQKYAAELVKGIRALERAGVELITMASNTPHMVLDLLRSETKVPILGIPECVVAKAKDLGIKNAILLGTKFTMQATFYQEAFANSGIDVIVPSESDIIEINRIVYDELVIGEFKDESKHKLLDIVSKYPIDGVILGCTELPLILRPKDTPLILLDTIDIYADATLIKARS